jgi:hypothetical protein
MIEKAYMARRQLETSRETQEELLAYALLRFQERGFFATTIADTPSWRSLSTSASSADASWPFPSSPRYCQV